MDRITLRSSTPITSEVSLVREYKEGDRVRSTTLGNHFGVNGRIVMESSTRTEEGIKCYLVRLCTNKTVLLGADHLELIEEDN